MQIQGEKFMSLSELKIIDVDAHISEPYDLWTSRAPAAYKDRVPRFDNNAGTNGKWVVESDIELFGESASSVVALDGSKDTNVEFLTWRLEDVHPASYDMKERVKLLDELGIYAQVLYSNVGGFGNQEFVKLDDTDFRLACTQIYNDFAAEIQADSNDRLLPMAVMPWWDIDQSISELERVKGMGIRGINMCSDPDTIGLPDLAQDEWKPFWDACNDMRLPVNFHIGASDEAFNMYGRASWPSRGDRTRMALGSAALFIENGRVVKNMIASGIFDRCPDLKIVSVESGIGWVPFILESLDYEWEETGSQLEVPLQKKPSEYFRDHFFACFWFEKSAPKNLIDDIGEDNVLFETDFPHPTCLYPDVLGYAEEVSSGWSDERKRKIFQDNAAELYNIPLPA